MTRVLVLDEGFVSGAIAAIALERAGCRVDVIAAAGGNARCPHGRGEWRIAPRLDDPRYLAALDRTVRDGAYDVLYPVTEPLQALLWSRRPAWSGLTFPHVSDALRSRLHDKHAMSALLAEHGIRVPAQSPILRDDADLDAAIARLGVPCVVKGTAGRGGVSTRICEHARQAERAVHRFRRRGERCFVQQYVRGPTLLAGGVFREGRALALFTGEKTTQYPARTGPAATMRSIDDAPLRAVAMEVFRALRLSGIASLDLIRDPDGGILFLEVNPRPWGSMQAARDSGVDLFTPLAALWRGVVMPSMRTSVPDVETAIFPLYLLSGAARRSPAGRAAIATDLRRALAVAAHEPRFAYHLARRLGMVGTNWITHHASGGLPL